MPNHSFFRWLSVSALAVLATACSPIYYSPNTHNVPLLHEQGDLKLALAGNTNRLEIQAAYAPKAQVGVLFDAGFVFPADEDDGDGGQGQFLEAGAGYFTNLSEKLVFDCYGLVGYGHFENHFPSTVPAFPATTGKLEASLLRYGIQPSLGFRTPYFEAIFSTRLVGLSYFNIGGSLQFEDLDQVQYLEDEKSQFLVEPALTLRGGLDFLKLQLQLGRSFNITNSEFRQDDGHLTIGLVYSLR